MSDSALASRSDEPLSCESDPFATSSDSSSSTASPLDFYADTSSTSSDSGTPAFLNHTPSQDPEPMECREPDPVSKATPNPTSTPVRPPPPPQKGSGSSGNQRSDKSDPKAKETGAKGPGAKGSAGGGSIAEKPNSPGAAISGSAARGPGAGEAKGGGKRETEADAGQRRQQDQTLRRLAVPPTTAARGVARIGREPLFLAVPSRTWSAPRSLDAPLPEPQAQKSPQRPGPPQADSNPGAARAAYAAAASQSEALFDRILAAAARLAREADDQLQTLTDRTERQLGLSLVRLEEDQAQRLVDAARGRDAVLERIATRADILRFYVVQQTNGALGRMSALRQDLLAQIGEFGEPVVKAAGTLSTAISEANKAGTAANGKLQKLSGSRTAEIQASDTFATNDNRGAPVVAAMVEAAVEYAGPRIQADIKDLQDRWLKVQNFAEPIAACGPCEADGKLTGLRGHADSLGVAGPRAIRSARDGALRSIDQTEQQLGLSVIEAHRQTEDGLTRNHDQTRQMLVAQAAQATLAMRRDIERAGRQQVEALGGVAATQPAAVAMVDREVDKAARTTPTRAAALAVQSVARLRRNVASVAERHPGGMLGMADRNHAARMDRANAGGREMLALTAKFAEQQRKFIGETADTVTQSIDQTLIEMAGVPAQVGQSCDSMIEAAQKAVTEAKVTIPPQMAFLAQKLTDACDGLIPISPESPPANPDAAGQSQTSDEPLMCTPADEPNMTMADPAAMSSQAPATSSEGGGGSGEGKGKPAPPPSCDKCDTAQTAARDRAAAVAPPPGADGANASGGQTGDAATTSGAGDDVGVSSQRTHDRSPNAFREHAEPIGKDGLKAPEVSAFLGQVATKVEKKLGSQVSAARTAIKKDEATDYGKLMAALRGMNETQAAAFRWSYKNEAKEELADQIRANAFNGWFSSWTSTAERRRDAALDRLNGSPGKSVMNELEAAFNFSNENEVIFAAMESLTQAQMKSFVEKNRPRLEELMTELSDADQARFKLLMDRDTVRARSTELKKNVDDINRKHWGAQASEERGFALGGAFEGSEHAERWVLEAPDDKYDFYQLEDAEVKKQREKEYWAEIQRDFGRLDGVAEAIVRDNPSAAVSRPDDPPGAMLLAYASRPLALHTVYPPQQREGETRDEALARQSRDYQQKWNITIEERSGPYGPQRIATTAMSEYQMLALQQSILFGSRSREARSARALAQYRRRDGKKPDYKDIEKQLHSGKADAVEDGNFKHGPREAAERDRLDTFKMMEEHRRRIEGGATGEIDAEKVRDGFRKEMAEAYRDSPQDLDVAVGVIDSDEGNMQAVIDQAIAREDPALLNRYLGRMDSRQIEAVVTEWNQRHPNGPGLREKLGVGRDNHWSVGNMNGAVFTGDEANTLETSMMGVPQNPRQHGELALRIVDQQIEQSGAMGRWLCDDEYSKLTEHAKHLRETMGVTEGDVDSNGRIRMRTRDGEVFYGNFDRNGQFRPEAMGNGAAATALNMLSAGSRIVADNYSQAVDKMASTITTIIAVIGAIVLTVATFGAGASVLVAMAIAAGIGALTIGVNAAMRGGRYSRDDLTRDVVSAAVQIATAGLNVGIARGLAAGGKIAAGGAAAIKAASLSGRIAATASQHAIKTAMLTQGLMGGMGSFATTALDPAMRRREDWGAQSAHAFFRGFAGGAVTAGISQGLTKGAGALVQRYAASKAVALALQRGASREAAMRLAGISAAKMASGKFMEVGVRGVINATSATAGRATELGYENVMGVRSHTSGDFYRELRHAFIQNAVQGFGEGIALRGSRGVIARHAAEHAQEMADTRGKAARIAGDAFDREMGRNGMGPRARGDGDDPAAASRPATPDEAARDTVERMPERPRRRAANDNEPEALPTRRAVGDEEPAPLRPRDDDDDGAWRTERRSDQEDKVRGPNDDPAKTSNANAITGEYPALRIPPTLAEHLSNPATRHDRIFTTADLTPALLSSLPSIPEKSRIRASDPKSQEAALANYRALRNSDPHREAMVARCINPKDPDFGQFMVIQGGPGSVGPPPLGWTTDRHAHPMLITTASMAERLTVSLPSGTKGDFSGLRREVDVVAGLNKSDSAKLESVIDIRLGDTNVETVFSVARQGDQYEYRVSFRPPHDGVEHMGPFYSLADYEQAAFNLTGQVFGARNRDTKSTPQGAVTSAVRGRPVHGEALTARQRRDIDFVRQRMELAGDFEGQMDGRLARGLIDPALGRAVSLSDAQTRVKRMGLVGEPDSMIRLHNILNDDSIPVPVRALISDATLAATRNHLIRIGQLGWDEPLVLLFHGATPQRTASVVKEGVSMARGPGGPHDDFGEGLYVTQSFETALKYRETRSRTAKGEPPGGVAPFLLRGRDLGNRVDVSTGATLRAQWEAFAVANARTLINGNGPGAKIVATPVVQKIIRGEPIEFSDFDPFMINNRGTLFNDFLASIGARPDVIFGDLGGPLTNGIQLRQMTNQAAVRSQGIADKMNRQHVRPGTTDADLIRAGVLEDTRNIVQANGRFLGTEADAPMRTVKPAGKKPADGSPDDPAELDAMARSSPHIDEINEKQAEFSAPSQIGPRASVEAIKRGGPEAAAAQRRLDSYYKTPKDRILVKVGDAEIAALAAGLEPGKRKVVLLEGGMALKLYRQRATKKNPDPPVRYDASVPLHQQGKPRYVWQFGDGELRVWRGDTAEGSSEVGQVMQASIIGKRRDRQQLEANMFSHGQSYKRTADTPIGPQAAGYHGPPLERGHLHGAGLAVESPFGIGLVPREVNQTLQNRGIEQYMRRLRDALPDGAELIYHTEVEWHKTTNRHKSIGYKIDIVLNGHRESFARFGIDIDADPAWTPQAQRRGTIGRPQVDEMEWPIHTAREDLRAYLFALTHIIKLPKGLKGLPRGTPATRDEIGAGLLKVPPAMIKRMARKDRDNDLGSFNPPQSQDFKIVPWKKKLNAMLETSWKRYIVVDLRGLGLKARQKQQVLGALGRLSPRDQRRIVLLNDKKGKPLTIPPGYRILFLAEVEDDDT